MEQNKLKVGDRIYKFHYGNISEILIIDRVTNTQAISGNAKFKIEYSDNGYIQGIARPTWETSSYYLENEKLISQYNEQKNIKFIKSVDWNKVSIEKLSQIIGILK